MITGSIDGSFVEVLQGSRDAIMQISQAALTDAATSLWGALRNQVPAAGLGNDLAKA